MEALSSLMLAGWDVRNKKETSMSSEMPFSSAETLDQYLFNHNLRLSFDVYAFEEWQNQLTSNLKECLGPFPEKPVPLNPRVISTEKLETFTLHRVIYDSRSDSPVPAYLLIPHGIRKKVRLFYVFTVMFRKVKPTWFLVMVNMVCPMDVSLLSRDL